MQLPITIGLHRSRFLGLGLAVVHLVAAGVLLATPWENPVKVLLVLCLLGSGGLAWLRLPLHVDSLRLLSDGSLELRRIGGTDYEPAGLASTATVHHWLTVFRLTAGKGSFIIVVAPDSMGVDDFRRLRVWLRWRADFSGLNDAV